MKKILGRTEVDETEDRFQRQDVVALRFPQSVWFDKDGPERWLEPTSPPFRRLVARAMVEDRECFWDGGEPAEDVVEELLHRMVSVEEDD
jgi:hypothetical protein